METLDHFVFHCGCYAPFRREGRAQCILGRGRAQVFCHQRDVWTFGELRTIRAFLMDCWRAKEEYVTLRGRGRREREREAARLDAAWEACTGAAREAAGGLR